ncbi:MAG: hypothetical protein MN733_42235 [Nitrososphaera sp.]|nr:hypothetical protein [Nitrososphaera sp.]
MNLKLGDKRWIVMGGLAIRCTIMEVNDEFQKLHGPEALLFYGVDEPVGHHLAFDELYLNLGEVKQVVQDAIEQDCDIHRDLTLAGWRKDCEAFIASTHNEPYMSPMEIIPDGMFPTYPPKKHGKDWFYLDELILAS